MKKAAFYTLGCRVNQYETESMKQQFKNAGYEIVEFDSFADVYVVNTCTVTGIADRKNRNILRRPKKINERAIVVATGCYAQTNPKDLEKMEEIDFVIGQADKDRIAKIVDDYNQFKGKKKSFVGNVFKYELYSEMSFAGLRDIDKAFVKIQDGCDRFCSFCKIPFARGRKRSRDLQTILKECKMLVDNGYKELVIIGIHLGAYGEDLKEACTLEDVLEAILGIEGLERLRISSVYPDTISDKFIDLMNHPKLMPQLHFSIQSASDSVLERMRRRYDSSLMKEVLDKIRTNVEHVAFTGDVIVGFPGETEEEFLETYNFIKEFHFSNLHIFPYSDRDKTAAKSFLDKVPNITKYDRYRRLNDLRVNLRDSFMKRYIGQEVEILVETGRKNGFISGYTKNYLRASIKGDEKPGTLLKFTPDSLENNILTKS